MIFQDPMTSLNPVLKISHAAHRGADPPQGHDEEQARARALELLDAVQIPAARERARRLPAPVLRRHAPARDDRDGARVQPARADLRRADHRARRDDPGADPAADRRPAEGVRHGGDHDHPRHGRGRRGRRPRGGDVRRADHRARRRPTRSSTTRSTRTPRRCSGRCRRSRTRSSGERLESIPGLPPDLINPPSGCRFNPRCKYRTQICTDRFPPLIAPVDGDAEHVAACWHPGDRARRAGPRAPPPGRHGMTQSHTGQTGAPLAAADRKADGPDYSQPPILQVRNLKKYFPIKKGVDLREAGRRGEGRRRRQLRPVAGRDARHGGRVGLRQVDHRSRDPAAAQADRRQRDVRGPGADDAGRPADARRAPRHADRLPGPVRVAQPAHDGRQHHRRAADHPRHRQARLAPSAGARSCSTSSA